MNHTAESINLQAVGPNALINRGREPENRITWIWNCPGNHGPHRGVTVSTAAERATARDILADPLCVVCRKAHGGV